MTQETPAAKAAPKVSVIIIFLNPGQYLEEAIESVFAQTSDDWELLLCDDGSTDVGTQIAKRFADQHPDRVYYLEHPGHENRGMSATRNLGLGHARGDYVSWLDADDVWTPTKIADQVRLLEANPRAAMVFGPAELWYSWTGQPEDFRRDFIQDVGLEPDRMLEPPELVANFLVSDMHFCTGVMVKRGVLAEIGNYEEDFKGDFEDIIAHSKLGLRYPVYFSSKTWYRYRQHPDQYCESVRRSSSERLTRIPFLNRLIEHMAEHGFDSAFPGLYRTLEQQRRHCTQHWRYLPAETAQRLMWLAAESVRSTLRNARRAGTVVLPGPVRSAVASLWYGRRSVPPSGWFHFGALRQTRPMSRVFGRDRAGGPIDRHYIESFLDENRGVIAGEVMEAGDAGYTERFGGGQVTRSHIMHTADGNPRGALVTDFSTGRGMPESAFDCVVLTQVLPFVWDTGCAIKCLYRSLKPGGVLLVTVPGISQISRYDADRWGDYWRFTPQSAERLFKEHFPGDRLEVKSYGNVLSAIGLLTGLGRDELKTSDLDAHDPDYPVIITVRAVRPLDDVSH